MSELINANDNRAAIRWKLLTGASILALAAYGSAGGIAQAEDGNPPQIWIELGGQLSRLSDSQETFAPALMDARPSIFAPSQKFERSPLYSIDEFGAISFQPENSDWILSASIRYGRSTAKRHFHQQTTPPVYVKYTSYGVHNLAAHGAKFADTLSQHSEHHEILDFDAGKDLGLGLFGKNGSSVLSVGVRFAQFSSKSNIALKSDPDWQRYYKYFYGRSFYLGTVSHANFATLHAERNFHGVGPSISWAGSVPIAGNPQSSELNFDWEINAALLFGRQRAKVHHQTTEQYHRFNLSDPLNYHLRTTVGTPVNINHTRSRDVTVPNVGGFAGISFKYDNAKISFGYKADFFFNAMDGGIDTRKNENRGFFGPYASISIGLGD